MLRTPDASAQERCQEPADARARYEHALTALERGRQAARFWWIGWTSGYSVATVAQGAVALAVTDHGSRVDSIVGAAESAFGVIGMLVATPRTPMWASDALLAMDDRTACDRVRRLRRAEELLRKSAREEQQAISWYSQLIGDAWSAHTAAFGKPRVAWHLVPLPGGVAVAGVF